MAEIGKFFIMAIFSSEFINERGENFVEEWMPNEVIEVLENEAEKKYGDIALHQTQNDWNIDKLFITVGGTIMPSLGDAANVFVNFRFHADEISGDLTNITVERG